ncbi:MAG: ABC transporter permease [Mycobacteriales bacterium]
MSAVESIEAAAVRAGSRNVLPAGRMLSTRFLRSELRLVFGRLRNQIALAVMALVPILIGIAVKVSSPSGNDGPQFFNQITQNGVFVSFATLTVALPVFIPLALSVVAGDGLAGEASAGTLRYLLLVPVGRTRLLAVKYAVIVAYAFALAVLVAGIGLITGLALFGGGDATTLSGTTISFGVAIWRLFLTCLYVTAMLAAVAALGLFVSTLVESAVVAMGVTAGTVIVAQVLDQIPQLHTIAPYLANHYWTNFGDLLREPIMTGGIVRGLLVTLAYVGIFGSLAWARFTSKDVSS